MRDIPQNYKNSRDMTDFERKFAARYPERSYLPMMMATALDLPRITWKDLTKVNLVRIADYIRQTHAPNSAKTLLAVIKSFLNIYSEEGLFPCKDFSKILSSRSVPSQHIALTEEEVRRLEAYVPKNYTENDIKILAMREILTGARGNDSVELSMDNVQNGCISYVSKKTSRESVIPLHKLLTKYLFMQPKKEHNRSVKIRNLKKICKAIGMDKPITLYVGGKSVTKPKWDLVGFHTLRRTFASIMASKGVPIPVVQKWMGHSNIMQTNRYICVDMEEQNKKYAGLFK